MAVYTVKEVAAEFRMGPRKIANVARQHGIGIMGGGRIGWRFTEADKRALWEAMKPSPPEPGKRHRRRRRSL